MELVHRLENQQLRVKIGGELDHHGTSMLRDQIDALIDRHQPKTLILDLKGVTFMDSAGIGLVMGRYKKIQKHGGNVKVCNISPQMDRIFALTGLYQIVHKA